MTTRHASFLTAACLALALACVVLPVRAQSEASALSALSAVPIASVVVGGSAVGASMVAVPLVLSTAGAVLVVKAVESTARGTLYVLERASDGVGASIEIVGKSVRGAANLVGASVVVGVVGAGIVLSVAGEAIAFIPNALGQALLHNERLTR